VCLQTRAACCGVIESFLAPDSIVVSSLDYALDPARKHIMTPSRGRLLVSFFALLARGINNVVQYNDSHPDFPLAHDVLKNYMEKWIVCSIVWGECVAQSASCCCCRRRRVISCVVVILVVMVVTAVPLLLSLSSLPQASAARWATTSDVCSAISSSHVDPPHYLPRSQQRTLRQP
jgi:hypothetical protein